ncbi:MAG: hypothetical protein ABIT23_11525 [Nitrosospira sp.]
MNMPGFTAEASIYKTGENYLMSAQDVSMTNTSAVTAQRIRTLDVDQGCTLFCDCNDASGACSCDATLCPTLRWGLTRATIS